MKLRSKMSGKVLDIVDMNPENGAHVQIWEDVNGANQEWKLVEAKAPKKAAAKKPAAKKAEPAKKAAPAKKAEPAVKAAGKRAKKSK